VEPARWCGGANLDYRLVRSNSGRSGDHFWLSLAQLADTGNPLIRTNVFSPTIRRERTALDVVEPASSGSRTFRATKPSGGGFIEEKCGLE
jgi:hypothetical protein